MPRSKLSPPITEAATRWQVRRGVAVGAADHGRLLHLSPSRWLGSPHVKKAFLVAVVVLLVLIGLPMLMPGMSVAHCDDCGPAMGAGGACLFVVLIVMAAALALLADRLRLQHRLVLGLLHSVAFDRPPQLA